jgi:D-serine deaminase-like pyridoxal phosphate-dependent protein
MRVEGRPIGLGDRVELTAPHIDPTVDRYERLHLCRGDQVERVVPVEARGRSA